MWWRKVTNYSWHLALCVLPSPITTFLCDSCCCGTSGQRRNCGRYESCRIPAMTGLRLIVTPLKHLVIQLIQLTNWSCGRKWRDMGTKLDIPDSLIWKVFLCSHLLPHWPNPQLDMQSSQFLSSRCVWLEFCNSVVTLRMAVIYGQML